MPPFEAGNQKTVYNLVNGGITTSYAHDPHYFSLLRQNSEVFVMFHTQMKTTQTRANITLAQFF